MLVYQPATGSLHSDQLRPIIPILTRKLFPAGKILSSSAGTEPLCQLLRSGPLLVELELYAKEIGNEAFEMLLKAATALEIKRKEQHDPSLVDISICILAKGFSKDFLARIPFSLVRVNVYEWALIQGDREEAVLIRKMKGVQEIGKDISMTQPVPPVPAVPQEKKSLITQNVRVRELTTPELVAFAKLGMELRNRKTRTVPDHNNPCGVS